MLVFVLLVIGASVLIYVFLARSNFGKDLTTKTDAQLYARYNRLSNLTDKARDARSSYESRMGLEDELSRTRNELQARGYDLSNLFSEETDAKLEGRPMNFARAKNPPKPLALDDPNHPWLKPRQP
jgi:hypothetical protein